jgi:hypothetical protein
MIKNCFIELIFKIYFSVNNNKAIKLQKINSH